MRVLAGQAQDAQAGTKSLLRMLAGGQDGADQLPGLRADLVCPTEQAFRRLFCGFLMIEWHVGNLGGVAAGHSAAQMQGHGL